MSFSNRIFSSLAEWAASVPPAPRCSECDAPLALGEVANSPRDEDRAGPMGLDWLCVRCAIHLLNFSRTWSGRWSECGLTDDRPAPPWLGPWTMKVALGPADPMPNNGLEPTCIRCRRDRESRLYLNRLTKGVSQ